MVLPTCKASHSRGLTRKFTELSRQCQARGWELTHLVNACHTGVRTCVRISCAHIKAWCMSVARSEESRDRQIPGSHPSQQNWWAPGSVRDPVQKLKWRKMEEDAWPPCTHTFKRSHAHMCTNSHEQIHIPHKPTYTHTKRVPGRPRL